jgi:hypothetical protein
LRLYLLTAPDGLVVAWCLADPKLGERKVAQAPLERAPLRPALLIVADKGFTGRDLERFVRTLGATLIRPDRRPRRWGSPGWIRQRIESITGTLRVPIGTRPDGVPLKGQLGLEEHGGRTPAGVIAQVAQHLLALTAAIWHHWLVEAPSMRSLVAGDH